MKLNNTGCFVSYICMYVYYERFVKTDIDLPSGENKTLVEQLDELREQLNTIDKIYQTVDVTANDARDITEEGLTSIDEAEKILDKIHEQLTVSLRNTIVHSNY